MKVCLIHTPVPELLDDRLDPPVGLLSIATVLNKNGHECTVVDLSGVREYDWWKYIPEANCYGFSTYTANYHKTLEVRDVALATAPGAITVAGGPHATALPERVAADFDYVVVGEGEVMMLGILSGSLHEGVWIGSPIMALDRLPPLDYSLVDIKTYTREFDGKFAFPIFTSRGCPFRCSFCTVSVDPNGRVVRKRGVESVVAEMKALLDEYGDISFRIKDDLFGMDIDWMGEFSLAVPDISYSCNLRGNSPSIVPELLADSGCRWACIGIESGSDDMLLRMHKSLKVSSVRSTVRRLKANGIKVLGWFIVGFPGETWDTVKETVGLINELQLDKVVIYPLIPYPGTDVWNNREKYGLRIIDEDFSHYFYIQGSYEAGFVYETDDLSPGLIREMRQYVIENT